MAAERSGGVSPLQLGLVAGGAVVGLGAAALLQQLRSGGKAQVPPVVFRDPVPSDIEVRG